MPLKTLTVSTTTPRTLPLEVSAIAFSPPMTSFDHGVKYAAAAASEACLSKIRRFSMCVIVPTPAT